MKKEVNAAHLEAAIASSEDYLTHCVLATAFEIIVGVNDGKYVGFDRLDSPIMEFCETGQKIAVLFDKGSRTGDIVMNELRAILPAEVELHDT